MKRIVIWLMNLLLAFAGCQALAMDKALQTRIAWLASCPSDPPKPAAHQNRSLLLGALVAAIGPKIIDGAVDSAAAALKAAGQSETFASTAKSHTDFYLVNQEADLMVAVDCLVVVRGIFEENKVSSMQWALNSDEFKTLQRANFQLEAKLKPLRGLKYFQLVPQYLKVGEFEESSFFDRNNRDFVLAGSLTIPGGAQPFGKFEMAFKDIVRDTEIKEGDWRLRSAASLPIAFPAESSDAAKARTKREAVLAPYLLAMDILGTVEAKPFAKAPDAYQDEGVQQKASIFCGAIKKLNQHLVRQYQVNDDRCTYPVVKARDDLESELEKAYRNAARQAWARSVCPNFRDADKAKSEPASCGADVPPSDVKLSNSRFTYFTTELTLSETREGNKFAMFLGNALNSAKADVSAALQKDLLPKTQAVKNSQEDTARTARTTVLVADLQVTKAEEDLADALIQDPLKPAVVTSARIALVKAKIAANDAHRKAGGTIPYPEYD